jgi:hypothetical protein
MFRLMRAVALATIPFQTNIASSSPSSPERGNEPSTRESRSSGSGLGVTRLPLRPATSLAVVVMV